MTFPRNLLAQNEKIVLDLRPHWIALLVPVAIAAGVVVGWMFIFDLTGPDDGSAPGGIATGTRWLAIGVGLVILLIFSVRKIIDWATDNFVVTTDRLIRRRGLIAKNSMEIPLEAINDVRFQQSIVGRMIGAGTLVIQSASEQGREEFANIRHPESVQKTIYEMGEANQQRMFAGGTKHVAVGEAEGAGSGSGPGGPTVADEIRDLDKLRDEGLITPEEFQARKKKLLDG